jgi:hypothetical protein
MLFLFRYFLFFWKALLVSLKPSFFYFMFCTGVAWLSSARGAKPSNSLGTGISPVQQWPGIFSFLLHKLEKPSGPRETPGYPHFSAFKGDQGEVGITSSLHGPNGVGHTCVTRAASVLLGKIPKTCKRGLSTDDCLQLGNLKLESPVIAD